MSCVAGVIWVIVAAPTPAEAEAAARRVFATGDYQTVAPVRAEPSSAEPKWPSDEVRDEPAPEFPSEERRAIGTALVWLMACVIATLGVLWIAREWRDKRRAAAAVAGSMQHPAAESVPCPAPLPDHARLAHERKWAEALHALLLGALADVSPRGLPPAWTSREALRRSKLSDDARASLGGLVRMVEVSHFGAVAASESEYLRALELEREFRKAVAA